MSVVQQTLQQMVLPVNRQQPTADAVNAQSTTVQPNSYVNTGFGVSKFGENGSGIRKDVKVSPIVPTGFY